MSQPPIDHDLDLAAYRARIDALDDAIVDALAGLLQARAAVVAELWAEKEAAGLPLRDPAREAALLARVQTRALALTGEERVAETMAAVFRGVLGSGP